MNLWGKTQSELDAERAETIARREYLARRDRAAILQIVPDNREADGLRAEDAARSATASELGMFYAARIPAKPVQTFYYFGEDVASFDSLGRECQAMDVEEYRRASDGEDDAGYGARWVTGIALVLLVMLMIGVALVML